MTEAERAFAILAGWPACQGGCGRFYEPPAKEPDYAQYIYTCYWCRLKESKKSDEDE